MIFPSICKVRRRIVMVGIGIRDYEHSKGQPSALQTKVDPIVLKK
jgi:hypothetical protein